MVVKLVSDVGKLCFYLSLTPTILAIEGVRWAFTHNTATKPVVAAIRTPKECKPISSTGTKKANRENIQQLEMDLTNITGKYEEIRTDYHAAIQQHEQIRVDDQAKTQQLNQDLAHANSENKETRTRTAESEAARAKDKATIERLEQHIEQTNADDNALIECLQQDYMYATIAHEQDRADDWEMF
ncbi:hypothetical protein LPJ66_008728 [Kickxella alabastrina]|uniref:Uncharacterized protein n=1 Tax=Kickxella alabastrina TaxID=61397 RepID=A0ACC1I5I8_9FUNG|nr:hypothetical protein LPJ66_008728 [Kickxella alabastrina]